MSVFADMAMFEENRKKQAENEKLRIASALAWDEGFLAHVRAAQGGPEPKNPYRDEDS